MLSRTDASDGDLEEIEKIATRLEQDEEVLLVAKQSRIKSGSPIITASSTVFATDRRVIIKSQTMLGTSSFEEISYDRITGVRIERGAFSDAIIIRAPGMERVDGIPKDKAGQLLSIIKEGMERSRPTRPTFVNQPLSTTNELVRLSNLKEQGILSEAEFLVMKQELLK